MAARGTTEGTRQQRRMCILTALLVVLVAGVVIGLMWSLQRSLIYFPDTFAVPPASQVLTGGEDITLHTCDGLELSAWFAPAAPSVRDRNMAVLVAPGNAGNRQYRSDFAQQLQSRGFAVLLMDYRGYSTNPGHPSEEGLICDGLAAVRALEQLGYPPQRTIYFGESIGGGVVAALLSERPPAGAVFRSPFTELADVGRHHYPWLPVRTILRDRFPVTEHVRQSAVPITVIRAAEDAVIPAELSAEVARAAPHLVAEHVIPTTDHNAPEMFGGVVADLVVELAQVIDEKG